MQILFTKDYEKFKIIISNREVNHSHVNKIKESILKKNLLSENPILVNSNLDVVDGQHRLEAAKQLGVLIFYIISDNVTHQDISTLNSNKKNWSLVDYLNFYSTEGKDAYRTVNRFINYNPNIPLTAALILLGVDYKGVIADFKAGTFAVISSSDANEIAEQIKELSEYGRHVYSSAFIKAFCKVTRHEKFDFKKMVHQVQKAPKEFVPCINLKKTIEMLEEIYNRNIPTVNRVSFK